MNRRAFISLLGGAAAAWPLAARARNPIARIIDGWKLMLGRELDDQIGPGYQDGQPKKTSPMRILVAAIVLTACVGGDSLAHDSWISRGNHRNAAGEWCCGAGDCFIVPKERVMMTGEGYVVIQGPLAGVGPQFHEVVPFSEAQPMKPGA